MLTIKNNGLLEAFAAAAGVSAGDLSLLIRIFFLASFFIWSAWCLLEVMRFYKSHPTESIGNLLKDYARVFVLVAIVISLVFIA